MRGRVVEKMKWVCGKHGDEKFFHQRVRWVLVMAQSFGLLPVRGVTGENYNDLSFSWYLKRVFYSQVLIFGSCFVAVVAFFRMVYIEYSLSNLSSFIFNANSTIGGIIFFNLAKNWPKLIKKWSQVESSLGGWNTNRNIKRKFYSIIIIVMTAAIVEHVLSIIYVCSQIPGDDPDKYLTYFSRNYPHLFDFFEFSAPLAVFAVVMNFLNVFSWNFLDAFLMIISLGLSQKFQEVTRRVTVAYSTKIHVKHHWMKIREDYNKISILCKTVNKEISTLIIVSFATNMFFITSQLYWSLSHKSTAIESIYFYFSFGLLVLRTVAVILFASNINDESKKSMSYLLSLNSDAYSSEIERFAYQIHCQPVALTGNDFFTITKGLLLGVS
ncbi:hypothetical protein Zmor_013129 [Zophobas morio]|uniref:Gustatory receptor n=1 Tax=Zophobas morio TaxID=2755281 RepID=A0AA38MF03_9CUCU|nr:hypothetical protein Zmor_013129 [Zophobas morio]